ncbi:unnamed protein product, partial [Closterium sp. NIES-54]
ASEFSLPRTAPAEALHTFTLDSGASRCFFRDSTTLTPLSAPVPVRLADSYRGPVLARSSTVLPCPTVPSGSLSGFHLPLYLPPLPPSPAPPCLPCVEGWQRAAPHFSSFLPTNAPLLTLHMDVWGPTRVSGQGCERYFLLVVEDYTRPSMEVARTSMIHAAAPHFLWPFAVWSGALMPLSASADKLSARAIPYVFLGFPPDAPGWQFYHPTLRRVFPSQDVMFDESVPFYVLYPYRSAPPPPLPLFLAPGPPPVDPLPSQGFAPSGVSQVDPLPGNMPFEGAEPGDAESEGAGSWGAELGGAEPWGAEPWGAEPAGVESGGA